MSGRSLSSGKRSFLDKCWPGARTTDHRLGWYALCLRLYSTLSIWKLKERPLWVDSACADCPAFQVLAAAGAVAPEPGASAPVPLYLALQLFEGATEPLRPDDPHPQIPVTPTRFSTPFWPGCQRSLGFLDMPPKCWILQCLGIASVELATKINSAQTRCIVKGEAQKSPLFWRFSGGGWFSQERLFSRNSTRKPLNLIKSLIFTNTPCKSTCLYNAPSMHTVEKNRHFPNFCPKSPQEVRIGSNSGRNRVRKGGSAARSSSTMGDSLITTTGAATWGGQHRSKPLLGVILLQNTREFPEIMKFLSSSTALAIFSLRYHPC